MKSNRLLIGLLILISRLELTKDCYGDSVTSIYLNLGFLIKIEVDEDVTLKNELLYSVKGLEQLAR